MSGVNKNHRYALAEIEERLKVEQHRLIHLCEKQVITPDYEDAAGRGTMRRFSERNLFEFALALELRRFLLPVAYITPIIQTLRAFEAYAAKKLDAFRLPESLQERPTVGLHLIIVEGRHLFFALTHKKETVYIGQLDLSKSRGFKNALEEAKAHTQDPTLTATSRFEVDLNKIAESIK